MFASLLEKNSYQFPVTISAFCQTELPLETDEGNTASDNVFSEHTSDTTSVETSSVLSTSSSSTANFVCVNTDSNEIVEPFRSYPNVSFKHFGITQLERDTKFDTGFRNRSVAYYGAQPYKYSGKLHHPQPFNNNPTLRKILDHVGKALPDLEFNSAMVTRYQNGGQHIPFHSDDENEIPESSVIATISLGQTRIIKFRSIHLPSCQEESHELAHGDVFTMTKASQSYFQHSIPKDYSTHPRISVTLRQIELPDHDPEVVEFLEGLGSPAKPTSTVPKHDPEVVQFLEELSSPAAHTPFPTHTPRTSHRPQKSVTLYLSSSMFRRLNGEKLSSKTQQAEVFFYPSATAGEMLEKWQNDPRLRNIDPNLIKRVIVLTGTNNVDRIMFDNTHDQLHTAQNDIYSLMTFIHKLSPSATIGFVNILPRHTKERNLIINELNRFLIYLSNEVGHVEFINTGHERYLFSTPDGFRKGEFFMPQSQAIPDNPHLNSQGVTRLGKHLKYIAHQ